MDMLRRVLLLALCAVLALSPAMADGIRFTVSADMDPVQYPVEDRALLEGVAALLDAAAFEGTLLTNDGSFDLSLTMLLEDDEDPLATELRVFGLDSHWGVQSPLLGDATLMLNNLAMLEFGVKANHHLGVPLQQLCLLVPYAHTSALAVIAEALSPLLPQEEGVYTLNPDELNTLAETLTDLAENDRTVRYWIEAIGMASGTDALVYSLLPALPEYLTQAAPDGLTVTRTADSLTWRSGEATLLTMTEADRTTSLNIALPEICTVNATLRDDATFLTGSVHIASPVLNADASFSLPAALPVTFPFYLTLDAEGSLLGEPLHIFLDGEARGNTLTIKQLLPDHSRTMLTITATLTEFIPENLPVYTPADIEGVNILSATSDSLAALMARVQKPLLTGLFDLLVALPSETVQAAMDLLEDSGILGLLTDAMLGTSGEY